MLTERVITVMASAGEFASWRPKRRHACDVTTSGISVVVELWLLFSRVQSSTGRLTWETRG